MKFTFIFLSGDSVLNLYFRVAIYLIKLDFGWSLGVCGFLLAMERVWEWLDSLTGGAGNQTSNPVISGRPALSAESQTVCE